MKGPREGEDKDRRLCAQREEGRGQRRKENFGPLPQNRNNQSRLSYDYGNNDRRHGRNEGNREGTNINDIHGGPVSEVEVNKSIVHRFNIWRNSKWAPTGF